MKTFQQFLEMKMGGVKTKCNSCGNIGSASRFDWNSGKARCRGCGGSVEEHVPTPKAKKPKAQPASPPPQQESIFVHDDGFHKRIDDLISKAKQKRPWPCKPKTPNPAKKPSGGLPDNYDDYQQYISGKDDGR